MTLRNHRFSVGGAAAILCSLVLVTGCETRPVTVTIKSVAAAKEDAKEDDKAGAPEASGWGNLTGTVTLTGGAPSLPALVTKGDPNVKDSSVCAAETVPNETLVVDAASSGIANVVIFLEKPATIKPELKKPPETPIVFDQKGCRFFPHFLLVRVGQTVLVKSGDAVAHNTHTYTTRNTSFNQLVPPNFREGLLLKYTKSESNPINVGCDLHPWMQALHFPVDHPYAAVTDKNGKFRIEGLPAGKHSFKVWQERGKYLDRKLEVTIEADKDASVDLKYATSQFN